MLASSLQDRPFIPIGTVVLQGAPRDIRACFRAWDQGAWERARQGRDGGGVGGRRENRERAERRRSLMVVPLGAAVAAAREAGR